MSNVRNKIGLQYGRLLVKEIASTEWNGHHWFTTWRCQCDCGNKIVVRGNHLQSGSTKSCGCLRQEILIKLGEELIGEKNPHYLNGKSCGKYTKVNRKLKERIRKRDNYTCQECGKSQEQNKKETGRILNVHHIDGDDTNNVEENMITLCRKCHRKLEPNFKEIKC